MREIFRGVGGKKHLRDENEKNRIEVIKNDYIIRVNREYLPEATRSILTTR